MEQHLQQRKLLVAGLDLAPEENPVEVKLAEEELVEAVKLGEVEVVVKFADDKFAEEIEIEAVPYLAESADSRKKVHEDLANDFCLG